MAQLSKFKRDSRVFDTGEWIRVGDEWDDLEILTRGFTDAYTDKRNAAIRKASLRYLGDASKITTAETRAITTEALIAESLLNVRNLTDDNGQPVTIEAFGALLRNPDYADLYIATITACGMVGRARQADVQADVKN